jgi:hypothetical protein
MSIAVLTQVYDEARRLAVAGSVVAAGDFRLKKLLPALDAAGAKAPVFAKIAEATRTLIEGPEDRSAENLLELTSLVTAVLYTQGETGIDGEIEPIESINLGGSVSQTSARQLKPLFEALSSTGSGRLELVRDAVERGLFRDLRLVKPALNGLDDPYSEVADLIAEKVLPMYGKAILPELRAKYDPKGTKGHPRRLKLMYAIEPEGTRELVDQALENGSKEVKVAAIACLGGKKDLPLLIEKAGEKAQDVRGAAYEALAKIDDAAAVATLAKALSSKTMSDFELVLSAIRESKTDSLTQLLIDEINRLKNTLKEAKEKNQIGQKCRRVAWMIGALPRAEHAGADALTLELFNSRAEVAKIKGDNFSGSDIVEAVLRHMESGSKKIQTVLARSHEALEPEHLHYTVAAGRAALSPTEFYDAFAPYLAGGMSEKKKGKDPKAAKQKELLDALGAQGHHYLYNRRNEDCPPLDPRWLDLAVKVGHLDLVLAAGRPGHPGAEHFLHQQFEAELKSKNFGRVFEPLAAMVHLQHPKAMEALITAFEKTLGKASAPTYWFHHLIPQLPKSAIPALEAVTPKLKDRAADLWLDAIQALREKE